MFRTDNESSKRAPDNFESETGFGQLSSRFAAIAISLIVGTLVGFATVVFVNLAALTLPYWHTLLSYLILGEHRLFARFASPVLNLTSLLVVIGVGIASGIASTLYINARRYGWRRLRGTQTLSVYRAGTQPAYFTRPISLKNSRCSLLSFARKAIVSVLPMILCCQ